MVSGSAKIMAEQTTAGLLDELSSVLRYDAYYAREFLRWIGILERLQNVERDGFVFQLSKKLGGGKDEDN